MGGLTPGPLHSLIVATALKRGTRPALRLAVAPLLSDLPAVALSLLVAATMSDGVARALAIVGGLFLIALGVKSMGDAEESTLPPESDQALKDYFRGAFVNVLNPNPWLFWLGVGAPLLRNSWGRGVGYGFLWLLVFYVGLVGVKIVFAIAIGASRGRLTKKWLDRSVVASTGLLLLVGAWLIWKGVSGQL
jgi:threonine/homoserine/homoserine lactone efflux protein